MVSTVFNNPENHRKGRTMVKLSSRHATDSHRNDAVHAKALALHITPEEVFARAFLDAGRSRSEANAPFSRYCKEDGSKDIPAVVLDFCEKPMPTCSNSKCFHPEKSAHFTRTDDAGRPTYFCSVECMNATPKTAFQSESEITSAAGLAILERVRIAMANAVYVKVPPELIAPLKGQPRVYFNPERQAKLVRSLKSVGQLMPGIIRTKPCDEMGRVHELLDGERRLRGVLEARLPEYRAMLVEVDDEAAPYVVSVISNFNREEHTILEIADSVQKLHEKLKLTMYQIAEVIGIKAQEASDLYGLRRLIPEVRDMLDPHIAQGQVNKGYVLPKLAAIEIARQPADKQLKYAQKIMDRELTVAGLREHIRNVGDGGGARTTQLSPEHRRRTINTRVRMIAATATSLNNVVQEEATAEAVAFFPSSHLEGLRDSVRLAEEQLAACRKVFDKILKQ